jgi:hypothetical protein
MDADQTPTAEAAVAAPLPEPKPGTGVYPIAPLGGSTASLADVMEWHALPEEVRVLAARVLGYGALDDAFTPQDVLDAYEAGFEECAEQVERPYYHSGDAERWWKQRRSAMLRKAWTG